MNQFLGTYLRAVAALLLTGIALHIFWIAVQPLLPWLVALGVVVVLWRAIDLWRNRW